MLLLTIGIVSILLIASFLLFDKDIMAPPTVVAAVFLFGCICCFYNDSKWELEFSIKSLGLIAGGVSSTMIGGIIGVILSNLPKHRSFLFAHTRIEPKEIYVSGIKTFVVVVFQLVSLYLIYLHIRDLTGYSNWMQAVAKYRLLTGRLADVNDPAIKIPRITRNMLQISRLFGVVYAYILGNNFIATRKRISIEWIPVLLYIVTTFIQGDRSDMIRLWVVMLVTGYTIHRRSVGWRSCRETKKIIRNIALSIIGMGVFFVVFREIVGRTTDMDPLYYVTFYAGSPIAVLNQMWEEPIVCPEIFGQRILFYLNQSTTALFGWPGQYNFYYPFFQSANGTFIGNAPTAFRPAYVEFGFIGFVCFMVVMGALFTHLYCICRGKTGKYSIDFHLLVYAYISYTFFMYFYSTFFDFLSHVFLKFVIELYIIRWVLVGWQFKQRIQVRLGMANRIKKCIDR